MNDKQFKSLSSLADLKEYIGKVDEDQNVILSFYDPKKDVASPMTERLKNIMDNEGIYTVTVAQIDRTKANKDILEKYDAVDCDCIVAIDKTKEGYPSKKRLTSFIEMSIKKLVINHKYKAK